MSYGNFASFYDMFTRDVSYTDRAAYIAALLSARGITGGIMLDLACGTGSLSVEFAKMGYDVIGVDNSPEMLSKAKEKCDECSENILLLNQDMTELDLYGTIRSCVCSLDSINHLSCREDVAACFNGVSLFMEEGGVFVFDINTPYKHEHVLGDNDFIFEEDGVFCAWHNEFDAESCSVDICLDFFKECENGLYKRVSEYFTERAYETDILKGLLEEVGFTEVKFYSDMTRKKPGARDERICCCAVKGKGR